MAKSKALVNTSVDPKPEGLRARKRRATENAIETSAVKLALELGIDNVTVEAICEMADISRSTFFNYFSSRDNAILGRTLEIPSGDDADAIFDSAAGNLPLGVYRLIFAALGHRSVNADVARMRLQLLAEQPKAARSSQLIMLESSGPVVLATIEWLHKHPLHQNLKSVEREAWLAATIVHSIVSAQMMEWANGSGDMSVDESGFEEVVEDAITLLTQQQQQQPTGE